MGFDNATIIESASIVASVGTFVSVIFYSPFFSVIKVLVAIYVTVLIVNIVLLALLEGLDKSRRKTKRGANIPVQSVARRKWKRIQERLKKNNQEYYKAAILEADQMVEKILFDAGYGQDTMKEKIVEIHKHYISSAKELEEAHEVSVKIIRIPDFELTRKETKNVLGKYEKFLNEMEIFGEV